MHRHQHPGAHQEGAQQAQREGADGQQQRPRLKAGALFGDRQRVQQGGARQPRHKGGVLHRVPEPPAAPAQLVVGPRRAEHDAQRQEHPRRQRPRAGKTGERAVQTPAQQRGDGEGEGHREADIAHVQQRRVENQPRVLQQRVQVAPLHRKGRQRAGERAGSEQDERQKTGADHSHHRQHPGDDIRRHRPAEHRHRQGPAAHQQHPQQQRALVRPPGGGHPVPHRQLRVRVAGDIGHGEVVNHKGVHQHEKRARHADKQQPGEHPGRRHHPRVAARHAPQRVNGQQQRHAERQAQQRVAVFRHHDEVSLSARCGRRWFSCIAFSTSGGV